jgi:hypothetical protein
MISVTEPVDTTIFEQRITHARDDMEERDNGDVTNNNDLEIVFDRGDNQTVGLRFTEIMVPEKAVIRNAYLQFTVDETTTDPATLAIQGEKATSAQRFSREVNFDISARTRTTATVTWMPDAWTILDEAGPAQRTPNIAPVIQEIVNQATWNSGNALAIIISGTGKRVAQTFNLNPANASLLHIEYSAPSSVNQPPVVDAGVAQTITLPTNVMLSGTMTDDNLPAGTVTTTWSVVSGPGTVVIVDAGALTTIAAFSSSGTYVLRLSASDGELTASDDLTVTVAE